jgi:hypothetical protein
MVGIGWFEHLQSTRFHLARLLWLIKAKIVPTERVKCFVEADELLQENIRNARVAKSKAGRSPLLSKILAYLQYTEFRATCIPEEIDILFDLVERLSKLLESGRLPRRFHPRLLDESMMRTADALGRVAVQLVKSSVALKERTDAAKLDGSIATLLVAWQKHFSSPRTDRAIEFYRYHARRLRRINGRTRARKTKRRRRQ